MKKAGLLVLMFGLSPGPVVASTSGGGEKVYHHSEEDAPRSLDPISVGDAYSSMMVTSIYDTILEYRYLSDPWELKPNLAESMPEISPDGLTFTIKLKKGVVFQDDPSFPGGKGREVLASDIVYSLKRHFDPANNSTSRWLWIDRIVGLDAWGKNGADYSKPVEGLKVLDPHTLKIQLVRTFPQFLYTLAMAGSAIIPHEAVKKYGKELAVKPVGSGPFKLVEMNKKKAEMVRNPTYRKEIFDLKEHRYNEQRHGYTNIKDLDGATLPIMDRVDISFMTQDSARWASMTKGDEIQFTTLPTTQLDHVLESKHPVTLKKEYAQRYQMRAAPEMGYVYYEFNMNHPDLGHSSDPDKDQKNKALRCAIRKAFDWRGRIDRMYYGIGDAFPGIIPPGVDGYDPALSKESITQDIPGAKKLLEDHGWNEKNLPVLYYSGVASVKQRQFYAQFRSWLSKIGYPKKKILLKNFANFGDYMKEKIEGKLPMHALGWGLDYPDAENVLQLYYGPNKSPGSNSANYMNPAYDEVYRKALTLGPGSERNKLYQEANKILIDDCVTISGFSRTRIYLWDKNVAIFPNRAVIGNYFKYAGYAKKKIAKTI